MSARVRPPAVAGRFYPSDPAELEALVLRFLAEAGTVPAPPPAALVAPHAGYEYSGPVAASAYALAGAARGRVRRAVLVGPSHHVAFQGMALPECRAFATPLGEHRVDDEGVAELASRPRVRRWAGAHRYEHSLEVQLPFLRVVLGPIPVVPIVTGVVDAEDVADVMELLGSEGTLTVVSSDLSHFLPLPEAREADARTARAVEALRVGDIGPRDACGSTALRGLLTLAARRSLEVRCVDLRTSGDTAGGADRVVGYGAFGAWPAGA